MRMKTAHKDYNRHKETCRMTCWIIHPTPPHNSAAHKFLLHVHLPNEIQELHTRKGFCQTVR